MKLNDAGKMVESIWNEMPLYYPDVETDAFIIMPNHIHGIINLTGQLYRNGRARGPAPTPFSLMDIIQRFKSMTTAQYRHNVKNKNWPRFPNRLWQRSYWERVIRNDWELNEIRCYIRNNPADWPNDKNNV